MSFGGPKQPKPPPPAALPDTSAGERAQEAELQRLAKRQGLAANLLTSGGERGLQGKLGTTAATRLLGSG